MAVTAHASGTQSCTVGTEHFLTSPNVAGVFQLYLDLDNLASGDILEVREYQIVNTGGSVKGAGLWTYFNQQPDDDLIVRSIPLQNELTDTNSVRYSIKQVAGTGRSIAWKVLKNA